MYQCMHYGNGPDLDGIMVDPIFMRRPYGDHVLDGAEWLVSLCLHWPFEAQIHINYIKKSFTVSQETSRVSESVLLQAFPDV
jgi:hypothetical protein